MLTRGSLSWGSKSPSSALNAWGSSLSPNTSCGTSSPSQLSARPSSGGSGTRPSTSGSDRTSEQTTTAWGSNSRPSSSSGVPTSRQTSQTSLRPRSAETRPGSSELSRFAEHATENSVAWDVARRTTEKLVGFCFFVCLQLRLMILSLVTSYNAFAVIYGINRLLD